MDDLVDRLEVAQLLADEIARLRAENEALRTERDAAREIYTAMARMHLPADSLAWRPTHRHVKRGSEYKVLGFASLQAAEPCYETAALVVYQGSDGKLWARPHDEFHDGRFAALDAKP